MCRDSRTVGDWVKAVMLDMEIKMRTICCDCELPSKREGDDSGGGKGVEDIGIKQEAVAPTAMELEIAYARHRCYP